MRSEWKKHRLEDCLSALIDYRGKTPAKTDSGIPLITAKIVKAGRIEQPTEFISELDYPSWMRRGLPELGDVVLTTEAPLGEVGQIRELPVGLAQRIVTLRGKNGFLDNRYLLYALQAESMQARLRDRSSGTTVLGIKQSELRKVEIELPSFEYQKSIAAILGCLDDRIDNLRQTNATLEAIAQALFKSWFVDFDPVRAKAEGCEPVGMDAATAALFPSAFEDSELGPIPKGWHAGVVAELAELSTSKWTSKKHPQTVKYVDLSGVHLNHYEANEFAFDEAPSRARNHLREGDTIVGTVRPGNRAFAYIYAPEQNLTGSTGFAVLSPKSPSFSSFVYLAATNDDAIARLANLADGGAYPAVRPTIVAETPCSIAREEVIEAFSAVTQPLLEKISQSNSMANVLIDIRDTLLPQLISGKLRLPDAEALIKDVTA